MIKYKYPEDRVEKSDSPMRSLEETKTMKKNKINIYLDKNDRKKLDAIKVKYQLSLTTIVDILLMTTTKAINHADNSQELYERVSTEYLYKNGKQSKTSILVPNNMKTELMQNVVGKFRSRYLTNIVKIYLYKDISRYIKDEKLIQQYWNENNQKMTATYDEFWHYNESIRYQRRMIKQDKEYWRKALEQ